MSRLPAWESRRTTASPKNLSLLVCKVLCMPHGLSETNTIGYIFRGSMTRPASSLTPASYAHCWAGTRSSLLTCWLGVSQVGLVLIRTHPLGNNNQFHEITLNSKVSGLPWREHAVVRLGA